MRLVTLRTLEQTVRVELDPAEKPAGWNWVEVSFKYRPTIKVRFVVDELGFKYSVGEHLKPEEHVMLAGLMLQVGPEVNRLIRSARS